MILKTACLVFAAIVVVIVIAEKGNANEEIGNGNLIRVNNTEGRRKYCEGCRFTTPMRGKRIPTGISAQRVLALLRPQLLARRFHQEPRLVLFREPIIPVEYKVEYSDEESYP